MTTPATTVRREEPQLVVSYLTLRQLIGWIALAMPVAVRGGAWYFEGIKTTGSVSAYYYTGMHDVFVSTLVLAGVLLTCYRTPAFLDNALAVAVGIAAVGIGLFPMDPVYAPEIVQRHKNASDASCYFAHGILGLHYIFVIAFFVLSSCMVYFRFPQFTPVHPSPQKRSRNKTYRVCGMIMMLSCVVIVLLHLFYSGESIFWPETTAIGAFAWAWLVKGRLVYKEPKLKSAATEPV